AAVTLTACAVQEADLPSDPVATEAVQRGAPAYLVTFRAGVDVPSATRTLARIHGLAVRSMRLHAAPGFSAPIPDARLQALRSDPRIEIIEADGPVALIRPIEDAARPGGGGGGGQTTPWGIER